MLRVGPIRREGVEMGKSILSVMSVATAGMSFMGTSLDSFTVSLLDIGVALGKYNVGTASLNRKVFPDEPGCAANDWGVK